MQSPESSEKTSCPPGGLPKEAVSAEERHHEAPAPDPQLRRPRPPLRPRRLQPERLDGTAGASSTADPTRRRVCSTRSRAPATRSARPQAVGGRALRSRTRSAGAPIATRSEEGVMPAESGRGRRGPRVATRAWAVVRRAAAAGTAGGARGSGRGEGHGRHGGGPEGGRGGEQVSSTCCSSTTSTATVSLSDAETGRGPGGPRPPAARPGRPPCSPSSTPTPTAP
jgi:hypothetical protein